MMDEVSDFTDVFLSTVYSEEDGWKRWSNTQLGCFKADHVFEQIDESYYQIILRFEGYLVTDEQLNLALLRLVKFREKFPRNNSSLLLIYSDLLVHPRNVPKGIKVVALSESNFHTQDNLAFQYELN
jgi:hypothetical protein